MSIQTWAARKAELLIVYQAAVDVQMVTDTRLSALLTETYGKRAGDMRYRPAETVEIADAMRAKLEAVEAQQVAWLKYLAYREE